MKQDNNPKTILIFVLVILGVIIVGGTIVGLGYYLINKAGQETEKTPVPTQTTFTTDNWLSYNNSRFGFALKYPKTLTAKESQNGDGVTLIGDDPRMIIRAYGSNNALSQSLEEYLNWVRDNLSQESENQEKAKEILAEDTTLGGLPAKERQWTHIMSENGILTLVDQITTLKDDIFYNLQTEIDYSDYSVDVADVFDGIWSSFQFN